MKRFQFLAMATAVALQTSTAHAQYVYSSDAQWGSWSDGPWSIYNDAWGVSNYCEYPQTLNITSINQWNVQTNQVGGGVKSYPNTEVVPNMPLSEMATATASFSIQSPNNSEYDWIFDVYTTSGGTDQIQIYESWTTRRQSNLFQCHHRPIDLGPNLAGHAYEQLPLQRAHVLPIESKEFRLRGPLGDHELVRVEGFDMARIQRKVPGGYFDVEDVSTHHDVALLTWLLVQPDGTVLAKGHDQIRVSHEGKIVDLLTFAPSVSEP